MDVDHKDYPYKNEISLSIGDDSVDSSVSTPSTITPTSGPTPSPRGNPADDKQPLTKGGKEMSKPEGIDNKAFDAEKASGKPLTSFKNGHGNSGLNESGANGANKNGQMNEKKLAGEILFLVMVASANDDFVDLKVEYNFFAASSSDVRHKTAL